MVTLNVNGRSRPVELDKTMPLLWALRDQLHLTGTKFGCGRALWDRPVQRRGRPSTLNLPTRR
jgi:hypothetical protein